MIKKLVYGLAIIAGLVSCNDDYTDWASPQSNDSKEPVDKIAFTVEPAVSAIDFVVETAENIQLFTTSLQDGQVSEYALTLSAEGKDKNRRSERNGSRDGCFNRFGKRGSGYLW